jgi:type IV pilus assembly protein PilC
MAQFEYKVNTREGQTKMGVISAGNQDAAMRLLQSQGFMVVSLRPERSLGKSISLSTHIGEKELVIFSRQFALMIASGLPVTQALRILIDQTEHPRFRDVIRALVLDVEAGARLSDALGKFPGVFNTFFVSMVRSGEASGKLSEMLNRVAEQTEKDYNLAQAIKSALIYPAFVLVLLIIISFYVLGWVVPQLKAVFDEFGAELPLPTQILIAASNFVVNFWWLIIIMAVGAYLALSYYLRTDEGRYSWDYNKMRLPIMGSLVNKIVTTRLTRNLATLISGDIPIVDALHIASKVPQNLVLEIAVNEAAEEVKTGVPLSVALEKSAGKNLPLMVTRMISVGETTGNIDAVLDKVADFYRADIDRTIAVLTTLLEPIIVVFIGIGVFVLIAAVLLPIYNLASVIQ